MLLIRLDRVCIADVFFIRSLHLIMAPVFKCSRLWSRLPHSTKKRIKRTRRHSRTRMTSSLRVCYQEVTDLFFHVWYSSSRTQTHDVTMWSQCHVLNDYAKDMLCVTPHKPFIRGFAFDWTVNSKLHRYFVGNEKPIASRENWLGQFGRVV